MEVKEAEMEKKLERKRLTEYSGRVVEGGGESSPCGITAKSEGGQNCPSLA